MTDPAATHILDDAIGNGLRGAHARFAVEPSATDGRPGGVARAARYRPDVAPFASVFHSTSATAWAALRSLAGADAVALFRFPGLDVPDGWVRVDGVGLTQMTDLHVDLDAFGSPGRSRPLRRADVPEMLRLVTLTEPGPFEVDTIDLGGYLGVFDGDELVAMAGRRMSPPGWTEISAVCTDPRYRGRGYARELVLDVLRGIRDDGDRGFLHVAHGNPASVVYESLGFVARREFDATVIRAI